MTTQYKTNHTRLSSGSDGYFFCMILKGKKGNRPAISGTVGNLVH